MVSWIAVSVYIAPLIWMGRLPDASYPIGNINIEYFGDIVDVTENYLTVCVELGCMYINVNFVFDQFIHLNS